MDQSLGALVKHVEPTIDWLTCTFQRSVSRETISTLAHAHLDDELALGNPVRLWSSYGYEGWSSGGVRWGRRDRDDLIQLSGEMAHKTWKFYAPLATSITRVDLAVTVKFVDHQINLITNQWEAIKALAGDLAIMRNYTIISPLFGGDTLYVGKRASQQYGRLYDKGLESGLHEFQNTHRWEVEYKKPLAFPVVAELLSSPEWQNVILTRVQQWFDNRLVQTPWTSHARISAIAILRKRTGDQKALDWLGKQIAPTVARLVTRGKKQEVLDALNLDITLDEPKENE